MSADFSIYLTEGSGATLGANFMAGHDVFFDIVENDRIGFAVSDCSYPRLINNTPSADQNDVSSTSSSTISPTNSPKPDTPTTSKVGIGKYFPVEKKNDMDACDSFACRNQQMLFIAGASLAVLLMVALMGMKYVSCTHQNLEELSRRKRMGQDEILSLMHPDEEEESEDEIDGDIVKEMEMREIS